jgi:hypothetical protein
LPAHGFTFRVPHPDAAREFGAAGNDVGSVGLYLDMRVALRYFLRGTRLVLRGLYRHELSPLDYSDLSRVAAKHRIKRVFRQGVVRGEISIIADGLLAMPHAL